jgi:bifunctional non-homologous end joining protein LigD
VRFDEIAPMLSIQGSVAGLNPAQWAFESKWDGYRLVVEADHGSVRLWSRSGRYVTADYPQLESVAEGLADHHVVLDGEAVVLGKSGVPSFSAMQGRGTTTRVEFYAFDLQFLDGTSLLRVGYSGRRKLLEKVGEFAAGLTVPELLPGDGVEALECSRARGLEGVVAKRRDSRYLPGSRSTGWIKDKHWRMQEAVLGGWRAGEGSTSGIGALLLGVPGVGGLRYIGRVGTGFSQRDLDGLKRMLAPMRTERSPFDAPLPDDASGVTFVQPELVGEVRYSEWTPDNRLRQPSWRGLRPDKKPTEVVCE